MENFNYWRCFFLNNIYTKFTNNLKENFPKYLNDFYQSALHLKYDISIVPKLFLLDKDKNVIAFDRKTKDYFTCHYKCDNPLIFNNLLFPTYLTFSKPKILSYDTYLLFP